MAANLETESIAKFDAWRYEWLKERNIKRLALDKQFLANAATRYIQSNVLESCCGGVLPVTTMSRKIKLSLRPVVANR